MDNGVSLADIAAVTDRNNNGGWGNNGMFGMAVFSEIAAVAAIP